MPLPCDKTEVIHFIHEDLKEIKGDVKDLLKFKNRLLGIIIASSTVCSLIWQMILHLTK